MLVTVISTKDILEAHGSDAHIFTRHGLFSQQDFLQNAYFDRLVPYKTASIPSPNQYKDPSDFFRINLRVKIPSINRETSPAIMPSPPIFEILNSSPELNETLRKPGIPLFTYINTMYYHFEVFNTEYDKEYSDKIITKLPKNYREKFQNTVQGRLKSDKPAYYNDVNVYSKTDTSFISLRYLISEELVRIPQIQPQTVYLGFIEIQGLSCTGLSGLTSNVRHARHKKISSIFWFPFTPRLYVKLRNNQYFKKNCNFVTKERLQALQNQPNISRSVISLNTLVKKTPYYFRDYSKLIDHIHPINRYNYLKKPAIYDAHYHKP